MRILWVGPEFLHPTTKGGQIRTLGILGWLARWHEVHYVAYEDPAHPEGPRRASEYSARAYPIPHAVLDKRAIRFAAQVAAGVFSRAPVAISLYDSPELKRFLEALLSRESFDRMVVDFLAMAFSCPRLERSVLFQHNVETMIWRRHAENARDPARKLYFRLQANRLFAYERQACRAAGHIIAVSAVDAGLMRTLFGAERISQIPTGVDLEYFARPAFSERVADLVFVGAMDWRANADGVGYFVREVLPLIRRRRPGCTFIIAGRNPPPGIAGLARKDTRVRVTGTVPDVRPYLWGSGVSVVPLRIGGGTRLKIYEAMAAGIPVVSTTVGAEGLEVHPPDDIRIADRPEDFAAHCLELLESVDENRRMAARGREMVAASFSWERVACRFAEVLDSAPAIGAASGRSLY
jgi:glycosyltransferase involved in cell wall biosynthesis